MDDHYPYRKKATQAFQLIDSSQSGSLFEFETAPPHLRNYMLRCTITSRERERSRPV